MSYGTLERKTHTCVSGSQGSIDTRAGGRPRSVVAEFGGGAQRQRSDGGRRIAPARPRERGEVGESVIAANLTIEGKIEGSGNVRMAGRFKGDVRIDGNFTIDTGAHLTGQVLASIVVVGGELQGNIEAAKRVDVLEGGVIVGDVKAGSITVAAGSRMRGHVEFGWGDEKTMKLAGTATGGS